MAEIAVLRTHIVNYAKTREVYVAYRKAGYSKKFREEMEESCFRSTEMEILSEYPRGNIMAESAQQAIL